MRSEKLAVEMGSREIRSAEDQVLGTSTPTDTAKRIKLGMYFIESDDRRRALGGGYTVGSTPVNIHKKPMSEADLSKTGGWISAFFIFGRVILFH